MELLYICDLKCEWLDFIYTFPQLLPGLMAGALVRYVLCGVVDIYIRISYVIMYLFYAGLGWDIGAIRVSAVTMLQILRFMKKFSAMKVCIPLLVTEQDVIVLNYISPYDLYNST